MKYNMSVWTWPYPTKYYLLRPWKWFRTLFRNIRDAYRRATIGYCSSDWMDFDLWFKQVASLMLREMAMDGCGYPGKEPFETPEKWNSWLHRMADELDKCIDEDEGNEYAKEYIDRIFEYPINREEEISPELAELRENYFKRSIEVVQEQKERFRKAMDEMLEHWECLWD